MDSFSAKNAKKINRHVLKAMAYLTQEDANAEIHVNDVIDQVRYQIRNTNPVRDLTQLIRNALRIHCDLGFVERVTDYTYRLLLTVPPPREPPSQPPKQPNKYDTESGSSSGSDSPDSDGGQKRVLPQVGPNANAFSKLADMTRKPYANVSGTSMSGDEGDRARKRCRSNNKKLPGRYPDSTESMRHDSPSGVALASASLSSDGSNLSLNPSTQTLTATRSDIIV